MDASTQERLFSKLRELGEQLFSENTVDETLNEAASEVNKSKIAGKMLEMVKNVKLLMSLVKDYKSGAYTEVPWLTIVLAAGAVAYYVLPNDLIRDNLPGGKIDDALVILAVMDAITEDLLVYKQWKESQAAEESKKQDAVETTETSEPEHVKESGKFEQSGSQTIDVQHLREYLDREIGQSEKYRTEEMQRLAKFCSDGSITDLEFKAALGLREVEG